MDFALGIPNNSAGNKGSMVFVGLLSKMAHLAALLEYIDAAAAARKIGPSIGVPTALISERDPRLTRRF